MNRTGYLFVCMAFILSFASVLVSYRANAAVTEYNNFTMAGGIVDNAVVCESDGVTRVVRLDPSKNLKVIQANGTAYRSVTNVAAPIGDFYELRGIAGTVGRVAKVIVGPPNAACIITGRRRSALDTGGTGNSITIAKNDSNSAAAALTAKVYNVRPTEGTTAGDVIPGISYSTTSVGIFSFGDSFGQPLVLRSGESFCLVTDTTLTSLPIMVEWTEATK